jgi:uncharacterized protein YbcI
MTVDRQAHTGGSLNQAIANAVVRQHRRYVGRGPSKAHAFYHHNVVMVVMDDPFTQGERSLAANGQAESVQRLRRDFQHMMRRALIDDVEALTGRVVDAYLGSVHLDPDIETAVFVLDRPLETSELPDAAADVVA